MPRRRYFFGPGFWWRRYSGLSYGGLGWRGGNPFLFCRNFPWLRRWWWATPYASIIPTYWSTGMRAFPYGGWTGSYRATPLMTAA